MASLITGETFGPDECRVDAFGRIGDWFDLFERINSINFVHEARFPAGPNVETL